MSSVFSAPEKGLLSDTQAGDNLLLSWEASSKASPPFVPFHGEVPDSVLASSQMPWGNRASTHGAGSSLQGLGVFKGCNTRCSWHIQVV